MNTDQDSAPRLDPEQECRMIADCIRVANLMIMMNGPVGVSAIMLPLYHPSVRQAVREHYSADYTVKFGTDENPNVPILNLCPIDGGLEESIAISSSTDEESEPSMVEAKAKGAHA